jgi:hypothetical protein
MRHPVPSHCLGLRGLGPPFRAGGGGGEALRKGYLLGVLTLRVPGGPDLIWKTYPYRVSLSDVKVIMVIMCVLMVELLCEAVTGQILALKYLLPGTSRGSRLLGHMPGTSHPQAWLLGARVCAKPALKEELDWADWW